MRRLAHAILFLSLLTPFVAAQNLKPDAKSDAKKEKKDELSLTDEEKGVIELTNAERKKESLPPLKPNLKLLTAARGHGENMAKQNKLDHVLDEKTPAERVKAAGYRYAATGENIAWNQKDPAQVLEAWMNSPGHRANILNKDYVEIGVACVKNAKGERYWVQVFGKQLGK